MTIQKIIDLQPVDLADIECRVYRGYFVVKDNRYYLLPLTVEFKHYVFKFSQIKSIKYLSNGVIFKK